MRKFYFLFLLIGLLFLTGCTSLDLNSKALSNEELKVQLNKLVNATYVESSIDFNFATEEMNLEFSPLITEKTLVKDDGIISSISYNSSLLNAFNLGPFELIVDGTTNNIYLNNSNSWVRLDMSDYENSSIDQGTQLITDIEQIINNCFTDFDSAKYIDTEMVNDISVMHYQMKINIFQALEDIYTKINDNTGNQLPDFSTMIDNMQLTDYIDLLQGFTLDIYVDAKTHDVSRVEINLLQIIDYILALNNNFSDLIPENVDITHLRDYVTKFNIGVNYTNINAKDTIEISDEAKNADIVPIDSIISSTLGQGPQITLNGASEIDLYVGETYTELGAQATDSNDGNITDSITRIGTVNTHFPGSYLLTYSVQNSLGEKATVKRVVVVSVDTSVNARPTLNLIGDATIDFYIGDTYTEQGATANDNIDGDLTSEIDITNNVDFSHVGTYQIVYQVTDSSGNSNSISRTINVHAAPTSYEAKDTLTFKASQSVMNPTQPIIYFLDSFNKRLVAYNLDTKETNYTTFSYVPEQLTFSNDKIYVTLLKGQHSSYLWDEDQIGAYAVVSADDFTDVTVYDIAIDPFDIAVDNDGYVYIPSGSGQWTNMNIYDIDGALVKQVGGIRQESYINYNPLLNKIYLITTDSSPRDIETYAYDSVTNSISGYDSIYHGDYSMNKFYSISPDGRYIFNGAGTVFTCDNLRATDINYVTNLNNQFTSIAYNIDANEFYILSGNTIYIYNYDTLSYKSTMTLNTNADSIHYFNHKLYVVGSDINSYVKIYNLD